MIFCAIHSLIEKDQKECFRKVWQVVAPLLIYVPFSVTALVCDGVNLLAEISQPISQLTLSQCQRVCSVCQKGQILLLQFCIRLLFGFGD